MTTLYNPEQGFAIQPVLKETTHKRYSIFHFPFFLRRFPVNRRKPSPSGIPLRYPFLNFLLFIGACMYAAISAYVVKILLADTLEWFRHDQTMEAGFLK